MISRIITGSILAITFAFSILLLPSFILGILFTMLFVYAFIEWLSVAESSFTSKILYTLLFILLIFSSLNLSRELFNYLINYALLFWLFIALTIILRPSLLRLIFMKSAPIFGLVSLYFSWVIIVYMSSQASLPVINESIVNIFEDDNFDNIRGYFLFIIVIVSLADVSGYMIGRTFGKIKLCESVSPNKTLEGFLASLFIPTILSIFYFIYLNGYPMLILDLLLIILCCITCTIGDLYVSILKRTYGKKDSGSLLPGHGGLLDRLDSYLPTIIIYYYWMFI